jgi:hypothetical protein
MKFFGRVFPWQIHNNLFKQLPIIERDGSLACPSCPLQSLMTRRLPHHKH